jgi:hypothetical protein
LFCLAATGGPFAFNIINIHIGNIASIATQ